MHSFLYTIIFICIPRWAGA